MPEHKYKVGDRVYFVRSSMWRDTKIGRTNLGQIIALKDINETPYCYKAEFHIALPGDTVQNTPRQTTEVRDLHSDQIAVLTDSNNFIINQIVRYDESLEGRFSQHPEGTPTYKDLAIVCFVSYVEGESEYRYIKLKRPGNGITTLLNREEVKNSVFPLTPQFSYLDYGQDSSLKNFLSLLGDVKDFNAIDFCKCIVCSDWIDPEMNEYVRNSGYLCLKCAENYVYKCDCCEKDSRWVDNNPRVITVEGKEMVICRRCSDTRVFGCRGCAEHFLDEKSFFMNSDRFCKNCFERACTNMMISPTRALPRSNISKLLLPDDKIYSVNKSKTPVALEIECISEYEFETDGDNEAYIQGIPEGWHSTYDGSLSDLGREFVMKPEIGDDALRTVTELCDWAIEDGWYTDNSCGVHVHTDAFYSGVTQLKGILLTVRALEPFLYEMLPGNRATNRYSRPMSEDATTEEIMNVKTIGDFCQLWYSKMNGTAPTSEKYNESRYRGLNLHSRILHGTIEYRYHHGTLNSDNIRDWMLLCLAMSDFGSKLMTISNKYSKLFINQESKDFTDYLSAMKAENLIPYVESMLKENKRYSEDMVSANETYEEHAVDTINDSWERVRSTDLPDVR